MNRTAATRTAALVGVPVLAAYLTCFAGAFQFDDYNVIVDNPVVHSLATWWAEVPRGNRPLLKLSYALNWQAGGTAFGFHLVNVAVHLANVALVYLLARLIVASHGEPSAQRASTTALIAALLFGLHPAQTEAVTYISGRSASLMATFYLAALLTYVFGALHSRPLLSQILSPSLFILAVATKESAVSLPLVLLAWEMSRATPGRAREVMRRLWPQAVALLGVAVVLLQHPVYAHRIVPDLAPRALLEHLLTEVGAITHLIAQLIVPWPLNIDPDLRPATAWSSGLALQALMLLATLGLTAWALRHRPWVGLGLAWFFIVLLPTNSILPRLDLANDRQLYLAGVGPFIALAIEFERLRARARRWVRAATIAVLVGFAGLTASRNLDYITEVRLWEQTARVSPRKARALNNLGFAYSASGCRLKAETAYRQALALDPGYARARENLANLLERERSLPHADC